MTDKITTDGKDYDIASLSKNANDQIANVKATDGERYISPIIVDGTSLRHRIGSA